MSETNNVIDAAPLFSIVRTYRSMGTPESRQAYLKNRMKQVASGPDLPLYLRIPLQRFIVKQQSKAA